MTASRASRMWMLVGLVVAALLIAGTYLLVVSPARSQVATVQSQVDDATLQQTVLRNKLRDLEATAKAMGGLKGQVAAAKAALPATADTQGLLRRLQTVATAQGARVSTVTISPSVASTVDEVSAVPMTVGIDGTADQLVAVLDALQSEDARLMTVGGVSLKAGGSGEVFALNLSMQMYEAAPPSAAAAGGTAATTGTTTATDPVGTATTPSENPNVAS